MNSKRIIAFILLFGIFAGLFQSGYFLLADLIGHGATKTLVVARLLTMYLLIKSYRYFISPQLSLLNAFVISIPIFMIVGIILLLPFDYKAVVHNTAIELLGTTITLIIRTVVFSAITAFIFLPLHDLLRRKINSSRH